MHHVQFWAYTVLICAALWGIISIPRLRGKGWLVTFLVSRFLIFGWIYTVQLLALNNVSTSREFISYGSFVFSGAINILSYATVVAFVLASKLPAGVSLGVSRILFSFRGRLTRQPYWIVTITLGTVSFYLWFNISSTDNVASSPTKWVIAETATYLLWLAVVTWIGLATQVKRWHDRNKSGWWVFIALVPIIGWVWQLVEVGFLEGTDGSNHFGPLPSFEKNALPPVDVLKVND